MALLLSRVLTAVSTCCSHCWPPCRQLPALQHRSLMSAPLPAGAVQVWDLRNQRCLQTLQLSPAASALGGHQLPLSAMAFSPQARLLVAGAVRLRGWRLSDGSAGRQAGHREAVGWAGYNGGMQEVGSSWGDDIGVPWLDLVSGALVGPRAS